MSDTPKGSRWREVDTGRVIEIISEEVYGTGPSWRYLDDDAENWHYCFADDFLPSRKRFERIARCNAFECKFEPLPFEASPEGFCERHYVETHPGAFTRMVSLFLNTTRIACPEVGEHAYVARTSPEHRWSASFGGGRGLLVGQEFDTVHEAIAALKKTR